MSFLEYCTSFFFESPSHCNSPSMPVSGRDTCLHCLSAGMGRLPSCGRHLVMCILGSELRSACSSGRTLYWLSYLSSSAFGSLRQHSTPLHLCGERELLSMKTREEESSLPSSMASHFSLQTLHKHGETSDMLT